MIKLIIGGVGEGKTVTAVKEMVNRNTTAFTNFAMNGKVKIKGLPRKLFTKDMDFKISDGVIKFKDSQLFSREMGFSKFREVLRNPAIAYDKFCKFKEAMRRGFIPNEIIPIIKHLDLEDTKREWKGKFNPQELCESSPLDVSDSQAPLTGLLIRTH